MLLLSDRVDEWLVSRLTEYKGKSLLSVARGDVQEGALELDDQVEALKQTEADYEDVVSDENCIIRKNKGCAYF